MEVKVIVGIENILLAMERHARRHSRYLKRRSWQRSIRHAIAKSRCRHARRLKQTGQRFKGGR